ncbi:hypothetical protein LSAT2_016633, partial [Lamellibrachia satsuma]
MSRVVLLPEYSVARLRFRLSVPGINHGGITLKRRRSDKALRSTSPGPVSTDTSPPTLGSSYVADGVSCRCEVRQPVSLLRCAL